MSGFVISGITRLDRLHVIAGENVSDFVSPVALTIIGNIPHDGYAYAMFFTTALLIIEGMLFGLGAFILCRRA